MKLKQTPVDFRVEELTAVRATGGNFALYRLDKIGWTTPDALQIVCRKWQLPWDRLSYGGLKDRHADTSQFLTIFRGPPRNLSEQRFGLTYLGQIPFAYSSRDIAANRFVVVVRHLLAADEISLLANVAAVRVVGVPNYFDDQRFGSVTTDGQFIGRELVLGRFEVALRLALAAPYAFDRAEAKDEKRILNENWGDWPACKAKLPRGHARSLVTYLSDHPTDFRGAIARLRPELQGIYLSAYQSDLWNRMLARWLTANVPANELGEIALHRGALPVPTSVPAELTSRWQRLILPLPCARLKPDPAAEWHPHAEAVLAEEGITMKGLKVPGLNKPFFSKGDRVGCLLPGEFTATPAMDELNPGRRKVTLRFELPRGCYATMVVKRLTAESLQQEEPSPEDFS